MAFFEVILRYCKLQTHQFPVKTSICCEIMYDVEMKATCGMGPVIAEKLLLQILQKPLFGIHWS